MVKIAIVNSSSFGNVFPQHVEALQKFANVVRIKVPKDIDEESLSKRLEGVKGIIAGTFPKYTKKVFERLTDLVIISRHGIGIDNVDVEAATNSGIIVCRVTGKVEREAMAEHTITLMLTVGRKIVQANLSVIEGKWSKRAEYIGIELKDKKIGLIGIGNIGGRVAQILKNGFNAEILAYDLFLSEDEIKQKGAIPVTLQTLLKSSDIISLHSSLNPSNYHMLSEKEFSLMKEGVIIINTARGELIDGKSLIEALKKGKIGGYGADVVEGEPIGKDHPLLKFKNVVIVPHIGAYTYESLRRMGEQMVENMEKVFVKNEIPENFVNPEVIKRGIKRWV